MLEEFKLKIIMQKNKVEIEYYEELVSLYKSEITFKRFKVIGNNLMITKMHRFMIEIKGEISGVIFIEDAHQNA